MAQDRTSDALDDLGPEDRALIELYLVRRLGDVEIAELLQVQVIRVTERRQRAFDRLAAAAGAESAADRAELIDAVRDSGAPPAEPAAEPKAPPGRRPARLALVAAGLAAAVALALALGGGDDDGGSAERPAAEPQEDSPTTRAALRPLAGGGRIHGFARLVPEGERTRLRLDVRGLPDPGSDRYALWLYSSVTEARRLAGFPQGRFQADVPLPEGYARYRFLDVSREPGDQNPAHSGQSVLRVRLARLRAPVR